VESARVFDGIAVGVLLGISTIVKQNFGASRCLPALVSALWTRGDRAACQVCRSSAPSACLSRRAPPSRSLPPRAWS
jgi:hypothetical protein